MRILAFDPGHYTGVAFLIDKEHEFGMTVGSTAMGVGVLNALLDLCKPDIVVVEETPLRMVEQVSAAIAGLIIRWHEEQGVRVVRVNPGQWKGMTASQNFKLSGQHQNDAALMAYWVYRHEMTKLVNIFGGDDGPTIPID